MVIISFWEDVDGTILELGCKGVGIDRIIFFVLFIKVVIIIVLDVDEIDWVIVLDIWVFDGVWDVIVLVVVIIVLFIEVFWVIIY